jgi:hypothetical protein
VQRIVEALIADVSIIGAEDVVGLALVCGAGRAFVSGLRKQIVGDAHFDVVGFTGENHDRFVLGFPAEARDRAIVAAAVGHAMNAERCTNFRRSHVTLEDFAILNTIENSQTEQLQGNAKARIAVPELRFKISWGQSLGCASVRLTGRENVRATDESEELMDAAVRTSIGFLGKAHFANRPELLDEGRNRIRSALAVGNEAEHGIFRTLVLVGRILRVRNHKAAGPAERRLVVANRALITVEADAEARRVGLRDEIGFGQVRERAKR